MRRIRWIFVILLMISIFMIMTTAGKKEPEQSEVFFSSEISARSIMDIFQYIDDHIHDKIAIKLHFGEEGNETFLDPELIKGLTEKLDATLVETNVLYVSKRRYTESHIELAREHGFDFAPIDILDSEGYKEIPVQGKHFKSLRVGNRMEKYDTYLIYSHFKGHGMAGFGGAIKNVAMGLASVAGKMAMHASAIPAYSPSRCISCNLCVPECPGNAISIDPLVIDADKCIGCGTCIGICPVRAFSIPWGSTDRNTFMERLSEYAKGISEEYNLVYINVLANITPNCDCYGGRMQPFMDDVGILASTDIVAIEQASIDLIDAAHNCEDTFLQESRVSGNYQINYAAQIGMGKKNYKLINIDEK